MLSQRALALLADCCGEDAEATNAIGDEVGVLPAEVKDDNAQGVAPCGRGMRRRGEVGGQYKESDPLGKHPHQSLIGTIPAHPSANLRSSLSTHKKTDHHLGYIGFLMLSG